MIDRDGWTPDPMLPVLRKLGVIDAAEQLFAAMDAGEPLGEVLSSDEVDRRLADLV